MPVPIVTEPISRIPTRETVATTLRAWIIDGTLAPEEVLRDADIARAFGISRTPVREALLQLEHEGLVESQPGRWTRVTPLDPQQLECLYPVRVELEALVARLAAEAGDGSGLAAAEDAVQALAAAVETARIDLDEEQARAARDADARFHDALLAMTGNPPLSTALVPLRLRALRYASSCHQAIVPDGDSIEELNRILAAIRAGDPEAAEVATRDHLRRWHGRICTACGVQMPQKSP